MATYKVIQDIEAEDKLLGPLTLKQFIYAGIAAVCLYISFLGVTKHFYVVLVIFMPVALVAGFFAWPWSLNQPTEVWALAKIRFFIKPRRRIWNQSGVKELVTITVPKKIEKHFGSDLSQSEVKSRLHALADTIDSRGWAIKNVNVNLYSPPSAILAGPSSDRLIDVASLPQAVPTIADVSATSDIMDERANPTAQHFDQMIQASSEAHRQQIVNQLHQTAIESSRGSGSAASSPNDYWFLNQSTPQGSPAAPGYVTFNSQVVKPGSRDDDLPVMPAAPTAAEEALAERIRSSASQPDIAYSHMRTIQPLSAQHPTRPKPQPLAVSSPAAKVTPSSDPAILGLARNNDLDVATIARQAKQSKKPQSQPSEVVISLR